MTDIASKFRDLTEVVADTVAREVAELRREAARDRELRDAEHRARLSELDAAISSTRETERRLTERMATLKDGDPGRDGKDGRDGEPGAAGRDGVDGAAGKDGLNGRDGHDGVAGRDGADGAPGKDGRDGIDGKDAPAPTADQIADAVRAMIPAMLERAVADYLTANPPPAGRDGKDGVNGKDGLDGAAGKDGADGRNGVDGANGKDGMNGRDGTDGRDGKDGKLPLVKAWADGVHYQGDAVTHDGATWQAVRDTGRAPPHEDWICLAKAGRDGEDGRSFTVRGTWGEAVEYRALDVVALNGGAFVARKDEPGPCPGDGWQMIAMQGKPGRPGERGIGARGERGEAGPPVVAMTVDDQGMIEIVNADGSTARCDLYPVFAKLG